MIVKTRTFRTKRQSCEHSVRILTWASGTVVRSENDRASPINAVQSGNERGFHSTCNHIPETHGRAAGCTPCGFDVQPKSGNALLVQNSVPP
ncbi:hypothetical protein HanHA300_Chr02g0054221 [Helianthus annuus]|nr:hypothetical protein HanHA300_Chr02g0054221 [Helianthus annuus]KAJ0618800.1 hypothetical protein HanHA89_Chr02g0057681 [Helianthus annuus]